MIVLDGERSFLDEYSDCFICPCCMKKITVFKVTRENLFRLRGNSDCELCRDLYDISSNIKGELVFTWNLIVSFIHKTDLLRTLGKFPPDIRYRTVVDLIPLLCNEDQDLVYRLLTRIRGDDDGSSDTCR